MIIARAVQNCRNAILSHDARVQTTLGEYLVLDAGSGVLLGRIVMAHPISSSLRLVSRLDSLARKWSERLCASFIETIRVITAIHLLEILELIYFDVFFLLLELISTNGLSHTQLRDIRRTQQATGIFIVIRRSDEFICYQRLVAVFCSCSRKSAQIYSRHKAIKQRLNPWQEGSLLWCCSRLRNWFSSFPLAAIRPRNRETPIAPSHSIVVFMCNI